MRSTSSNARETILRSASFTGAALCVVALLGPELASFGEWPVYCYKASGSVVRASAALAAPMLEPNSFMTLSAAAMILLLVTRACRNQAFDGGAVLAAAGANQRVDRGRVQSRKSSISHHIGGLYGP